MKWGSVIYYVDYKEVSERKCTELSDDMMKKHVEFVAQIVSKLIIYNGLLLRISNLLD